MRFTSQNDFLTNNPTNDDHYTASFELELVRAPYTITFRENAFTDREAGRRFDETFLLVEHTFRGLDPWRVTAEAGVVHVGRGFFGQELQNAVHRVLGNDEVDFEYVDALVRPSAGAVAERLFWRTRHVAVGPRLEAFGVPDLRAHAVVAVESAWTPSASVDLPLVAGARFSHASLEALEPHLATLAPVARVGVVLYDRVLLAWAYNDYGDRREHVSIGYRFGFGDREPAQPASREPRARRTASRGAGARPETASPRYSRDETGEFRCLVAGWESHRETGRTSGSPPR